MNLLGYQKEAIDFGITTSRHIIRLDTGLGKSRVAIEMADRLEAKTLVIAPAFLLPNWKREIEKWSIRFEGGKLAPFDLRSYSYFSRGNSVEPNYDLVVCDEAHYLKNWGSKRTKNIIFNVLSKAKRVALLSATPMVKSAADLHPLFSVCQPGKWGKFIPFCEKYCLVQPDPFSYSGKKYVLANPTTVHELAEAAKEFMFSRLHHEVAHELPKKREILVEVEVNDSSLRKLDIPDEQLESYIEGLSSEYISSVRASLGIAKVPLALEWIDNFNNTTGSLVVFTWHRAAATTIYENVKQDKDAYLILGGMNAEDRDTKIETWKRNGGVLIGTIGALGVGLNLDTSSHALFVECPWSHAETKQCEDRLVRLTQKSATVTIFKMVAKGTIDEAVLRLIASKKRADEMALGAQYN